MKHKIVKLVLMKYVFKASIVLIFKKNDWLLSENQPLNLNH
ncbi:hypothetical protein DDD_1233 [Nonlabens dokdonensis DSW-6]|uniref:Uncharacterized protein n=1 Tax=Nonlabens dokdonensis (strain DSM 17205 / KCTC 12402 / DSW-6) TaxID=592029 RepID=L7W450_NONDD|nr:hypothetical protein DDD_1233 [Nonlabens dokdonensis DSW-6]